MLDQTNIVRPLDICIMVWINRRFKYRFVPKNDIICNGVSLILRLVWQPSTIFIAFIHIR